MKLSVVRRDDRSNSGLYRRLHQREGRCMRGEGCQGVGSAVAVILGGNVAGVATVHLRIVVIGPGNLSSAGFLGSDCAIKGIILGSFSDERLERSSVVWPREIRSSTGFLTHEMVNANYKAAFLWISRSLDTVIDC